MHLWHERRAFAHWCPIKLLCVLRMIFAKKSVINHFLCRYLYQGILSPYPNLGGCYFLLNINYLCHARACPGHPGVVYECGNGRQEGFFQALSLKETSHQKAYGSDQACWQAPSPTKATSFVALDCRNRSGNDVLFMFINELSN